MRSKNKYLVNNWNWSKVESFSKNWNFVQKLKLWSKVESFSKNWNFVQKLKFYSKIVIFSKNWNFIQKLKFFPKTDIKFNPLNFFNFLKFSNKKHLTLIFLTLKCFNTNTVNTKIFNTKKNCEIRISSI